MRRLAAGDALVIATHNRGKLEEFRQMLAPYGLVLSCNADHGLGEPDETEESFAGNARIKARAATLATGLPALADDSGLEVDALGGQPGVRTADWAETPLGRDFGMAMKKVHDALEAVSAPEPRAARFCSTLVLCWPDGSEAVYEGIAPGRIVWPPRGAQGHGFDPVFLPDGHDRTFAEMEAAEKNAISHRARSFAAFVAGSLG